MVGKKPAEREFPSTRCERRRQIVYMPLAHSFYDLVAPDRYFENHPEYFALVYGRRQREGAQLCLTNADVLRVAVEQLDQWLVGRSDVSIVSVSQNDSGGWCECEPCRQVIKEEGGAISGLALRFVNQVAERVGASYPGKIFDMLAYQDTADPPSKVRPRANVQIRLCPMDACQAHSYRTCAYNRPISRAPRRMVADRAEAASLAVQHQFFSLPRALSELR